MRVLSFEEKKAIFQSFKLKEKKISNGRVSYVYPESNQKGQVLATQLHPSGNGYVVGKYMSEETIKKHGYEVDPRGWISIKVFSKDEIAKVITEAMKSMCLQEDEAEGIIEKQDSLTTAVPANEVTDQHDAPSKEQIQLKEEKPKIEIQPASPLEVYPGSCLFAWMGLALSTMEYGFLIWRKAVRDYVGTDSKG